jgi:hypothetical protein
VRREFTGPIELTVTGHPGFSGTVTVPNAPPPPANQPAPPIAFLPVTCKADVPMGAYELRVMARANIGGKEVSKAVLVRDVVKAALSGLPFPPPEMLTSVGVAVTDKPVFSLAVKLANADVIRGVPANVTVTATRSAGFAEEIPLTAFGLPANVTAAVKPIPKGANEVQFPLTAAANAGLGPLSFTFRGTTKSGGKEFAYFAAPAKATISLPVEVKAEPSPVTIKVGQKAKLKVNITRKGDYKGPVDVELKNLPANVTAPKVTLAPDKTSGEVELSAAMNAAVADKADVQAVATATGAGNQQANSANIVLKVEK